MTMRKFISKLILIGLLPMTSLCAERMDIDWIIRKGWEAEVEPQGKALLEILVPDQAARKLWFANENDPKGEYQKWAEMEWVCIEQLDKKISEFLTWEITHKKSGRLNDLKDDDFMGYYEEKISHLAKPKFTKLNDKEFLVEETGPEGKSKKITKYMMNDFWVVSVSYMLLAKIPSKIQEMEKHWENNKRDFWIERFSKVNF